MRMFAVVLFALLCAVHLWACYRQNHKLRAPTKILLMPALGLLYALWAKSVTPLVIVGMLLGCIGDALLLDKDGTPRFMLGILAFALGHVCYMAAMARHFGFASLTPFRVLGISAGYALYLAAVYTRTKNYISTKLLAGAGGYMLLLCGTSACALLCLLKTPSLPTVLLFTGSLFFILSDSVLTWTVCLQREDKNHLVMSTYLAAQCLIAAAFAI